MSSGINYLSYPRNIKMHLADGGEVADILERKLIIELRVLIVQVKLKLIFMSEETCFLLTSFLFFFKFSAF